MKKLGAWLVVYLMILPCLCDGGEFSMPIHSAANLDTSIHVYDREGRPLRSFLSAQENYFQPVKLAEVSPWMISATIAAEDKRFYTHPGVDWRAVLRAGWQNIRFKGVVSGASTITQQLARALHPRAKNWRNKWAEAWQAIQLERKYSKEEILEQYFNVLEFGNNTQGVEAAANFYFGVSASELTLSQSALLTGLIQSPTRLNPVKNETGALARRNRVLRAMQKNNFISPEQYQLAAAEPLGVQLGKNPFNAPHFTQLLARIAPHQTTIYSTLDGALQRYAEQTVRTHLAELVDQHVTNAAVVVLDNTTGEVLAYVGSADFADQAHAGQIDGVQTRRQPGSALKPFVYGLALENGLTAASILADEDTFFEGGFRPRNYDGNFHGAVSVRKALANSYNVPVIKAAEPLGAARILQRLQALGFVSLNRSADFYGLGLALGGGEVTLLELANAYATLARGGVLRPIRVGQEPPLLLTSKTVRVMPAEIAYVLTDILADNSARAEAFGLNSALYFPFPVAAKTGTSKDYKDNFAIGYTPRITVAVWVGNFDASAMQKVSGITGAGPIFHDILTYANQRYPSGDFPVPEHIEHASVCVQSGLLAGPSCKHLREEVFVQGTAPHQVCDGHHQAGPTVLQFLLPLKADIYAYDPSLPAGAQQLHIQAVGAEPPCRWLLNGNALPQTDLDFFWPLERGKFDLSVSCGSQTDTTFFTVL